MLDSKNNLKKQIQANRYPRHEESRRYDIFFYTFLTRALLGIITVELGVGVGEGFSHLSTLSLKLKRGKLLSDQMVHLISGNDLFSIFQLKFSNTCPLHSNIFFLLFFPLRLWTIKYGFIIFQFGYGLFILSCGYVCTLYPMIAIQRHNLT